jgi:hypothetical protein
VADTQATLKRIGLTPGKAILIGVLGIVLVGVVYKQFRKFAADEAVIAAPAVNAARAPKPRAAVQATSSVAVAQAESPGDTPVEMLELDQEKWKSPDLSAVIAYDPFALPATFPQPTKFGLAEQLAEGGLETSAAADAEQLAEALERLQQQLEELKNRGVHVIVNKNDQYVAMIGDRMIHVGDEINGFIVTEIDLQGVRVERKQAE